MKNILIVSGHVDLNDSVANKEILSVLEKKLPGATFDYLDRLYPDFRIDTAAEQQKLVAADVIVLQFPMFWFSMPSLLERWMECTFLHGFAHGSTGDKLRGKKLVISYTTGAPAEAFTKEAMGCTAEDIFLPVRLACGFTGMEYAGAVATGGVSYHMRRGNGATDQIRAKADDHAERLLALLATL